MRWQILGSGSKEKSLSTQKWLVRHGVRKDAVELHQVDKEKIQSTEEFLKERGVDKSAVMAGDIAKSEIQHRHFGRTVVLLSLVIPMSIAPFWLMALLSLPAFEKKVYSEGMQAALLAALVSDFVGLYYVITRDLFPQGSTTSRKTARIDADRPNRDRGDSEHD